MIIPLPDKITSVEMLEDLLSDPTPTAVAAMSNLKGDLLILGVAGKMGPTLARMARRASELAGVSRDIIGVARFTNPAHRVNLERQGIQTIQADLLDPRQLAALPDAPNVLYMPAMKFGSTHQEPLTWGMNALLAADCARKFRNSKIVAFSTGNIYGLIPVARGGSVETDPPAPTGEYAMSCLGRERMFEYLSQRLGTQVALIRLNYATELRYGLFVDLAQKVLAGEPIDLSMGYFNAIWQADASAQTLAAFDHVASPPFIINITSPEILSTRGIAERLADLLHKPVRFAGTECPDALLSSAARAKVLFGPPRVSTDQLLIWTADWIAGNRETLNKPTHFESRDGQF